MIHYSAHVVTKQPAARRDAGDPGALAGRQRTPRLDRQRRSAGLRAHGLADIRTPSRDGPLADMGWQRVNEWTEGGGTYFAQVERA